MSRSAVFAIALLAAPPALAQELYRSVAGWDVLRIGEGCYAATSYEDDTELYAGFDTADGVMVLTILNPGWTGIADGDPVPTDLSFGDREFGFVVMTGVVNEAGVPGVSYVLEPGDEMSALMGDLMDEGDLTLSQDGEVAARLDMSGMGAAFIVVGQCAGLG